MKSKDKSSGTAFSVWSEPLGDFVENIASARPTPGGGAVAAFSACLAASLLRMVLDIAAKNGSNHGDMPVVVQAYLEELQRCVDSDVEAFDSFVAARKMSAVPEADQSRRQELLAKTLRQCVVVPLNTARLALKLVPIALHISEVGPDKIKSDAGVALLQLDCSLVGLLFNVDINLHGVASDSTFNSLREERDLLAGDITAARRDLSQAIRLVAKNIKE
jgi:formiminotetrahydrofolate cyclodeaminase